MDIKLLKTAVAAAAMFMSFHFGMMAQDTPDKNPQVEEYARRYDLLVSRLGPDGVGIETLLDNWAEIAPDDIRLLTARFSYYFAKSQSTEVVPKAQKRILRGRMSTISRKFSITTLSTACP